VIFHFFPVEEQKPVVCFIEKKKLFCRICFFPFILTLCDIHTSGQERRASRRYLVNGVSRGESRFKHFGAPGGGGEAKVAEKKETAAAAAAAARCRTSFPPSPPFFHVLESKFLLGKKQKNCFRILLFRKIKKRSRRKLENELE
jgi:hypothetical protein